MGQKLFLKAKADRLDISMVQLRRALGVNGGAWAKYCNDTRRIPRTVLRSLEMIERLEPETLDLLMAQWTKERFD